MLRDFSVRFSLCALLLLVSWATFLWQAQLGWFPFIGVMSGPTLLLLGLVNGGPAFWQVLQKTLRSTGQLWAVKWLLPGCCALTAWVGYALVPGTPASKLGYVAAAWLLLATVFTLLLLLDAAMGYRLKQKYGRAGKAVGQKS